MAMADWSKIGNGRQPATDSPGAHGILPAPAAYAIFRETTWVDGRVHAEYRVPGHPDALTAPDFTEWQRQTRLDGAHALGLFLLVIREVVDDHGAIRECVMERRRGAIDGPFTGNPARVEFTGPARAVRLYEVNERGELQPVTPAVPPPSHEIIEAMAGENAAIRARFGPETIVLDRRAPTLFEEMAGLSGVVHVRTTDGDAACGIGWHGPILFLLVADFQRLDRGPSLPPAQEAMVSEVVRARNLERHELRVDAKGPCVIARRRDRPELVVIRPHAGGARVEPHDPGDGSDGLPDQQRWIRYAAAHEGRMLLDAYRDGASGDLIVFASDQEGRVWRHRIDADGREAACTPADDSGIAALLHARSVPDEAEPPLSAAERQPKRPETVTPPGTPPAEDSLLAICLAHDQAVALFRAARVPDLPWHEAEAQLVALDAPLRLLQARATALALHAFLRRARAASPSADMRAEEIAAIARLLDDELAATQVMIIARQWPGESVVPDDPALDSAFPTLVHDRHEAYQCLALGRGDAAVFHAMRLLRGGLATLLGFGHNPPEDWAAIMAATADRTDLPETVGHALTRVWSNWRAPRLLPELRHSLNEAQQILDSVIVFLRTVAAHPIRSC